MKQVKVCLGRFMPFTLGHLKLATYADLKGPDSEQSDNLREQPDIDEIKKQKTIILAVSTPEEKRDTRHPFTDDMLKQEFDLIKRNYSEIEDVLYVKSADICAWGEMLKQKGYQASVWLTGSDEYKIYKMMAMKVPEYEEHNRDNRDCKDAYTKSFYVEEVTRSETGDFIESISATKVRQALIGDNRNEFKKMMPKGADKFFDEFKQAVETAPETKKKRKVKEHYKSVKEYIIERYVKKKYVIILPCGDDYYSFIFRHEDDVDTYLKCGQTGRTVWVAPLQEGIKIFDEEFSDKKSHLYELTDNVSPEEFKKNFEAREYSRVQFDREFKRIR